MSSDFELKKIHIETVPRAIDRAGIQFRTLNASKGAAVRATRAQADRELYRAAIRGLLLAQDNLEIVEAAVDDLVVSGDRVSGARCTCLCSHRRRRRGVRSEPFARRASAARPRVLAARRTTPQPGQGTRRR